MVIIPSAVTTYVETSMHVKKANLKINREKFDAEAYRDGQQRAKEALDSRSIKEA